MIGVMLTTSDNPWNPFTHFDEWYAFDENEKGYRTSDRVSALIEPDYQADDQDQADAWENTLDRMIELFPFGPLNGGLDAKGNQIVYKKVYETEEAMEKSDENDKKETEIKQSQS